MQMLLIKDLLKKLDRKLDTLIADVEKIKVYSQMSKARAARGKHENNGDNTDK